MKRYIFLLLCCLPILSAFSFEIERLRTEGLDEPEGIATGSPALSWTISSEKRNIAQNEYRILVASSKEKLAKNEGDIWDSGTVKDNRSNRIAWGATPLDSRTDAWWKVCVNCGKAGTKWSAPAHFSTGLLNDTDWSARWIGMDKLFPGDSLVMHSRLSARYLRKEFASDKAVRSAKLYLSGLGRYELYLNGSKVGNQVLAPVPSHYDETVYYNTFDVTSLIRTGKNAIGTVLGNGIYFNMRQNHKPHKIQTYGFPKLILQLEIEYTDGSSRRVVSDQSWRLTVDGPIRANNEWDGEEYDANKEMPGWNTAGFNDRSWLKPQLVEAPKGKLRAQMTPNMIVHESIHPIGIKQLKEGVYILDMGQNMVGWLRMKVQGAKGTQVKLRFAETLNEDGSLFVRNLRSARCTDRYTLKGEGREEWEPSFVYHGFRYVEISGYPGEPSVEDFTGRVVYDAMETIGTFRSSNEILTQLHKNAYWGIRGNYKGMPIDCPQRDERQPWMGDRATGSLGESYIFDNERLYAKWMNDIREAQRPDGQLSDISPAFYKTYYSDNMTWPGTYLLVADMLYVQFGNAAALTDHYPAMKKWFFYMKDKYLKEGIMTKDKYGDWCVPPESLDLIHSKDPARKTDGQLIATAYFYHFLSLMQKFAKISGNEQDIAAYQALQAEVRPAFNKRFFEPKEHFYGNNTVTANLLPLAFGMVEAEEEEAVFQQVLYKISVTDKLHISTGVIGTQWLMRELSRRGRTDLAYTVASQKDYPGWGYMIGKGATTIWELWNGDTANPWMNSRNHVMLLGDVITWMYQDLAGIRPHKSYPGFARLWMEPKPAEDLTEVSATYRSVAGLIESTWTLDPDTKAFVWKVRIPANTRANVLIPAASVDDITESGKPVMEVEGLKFVRIENNRVNLEIGSGEYTFSCRYGQAGNRWRKGIVADEFICRQPPFPESHAATIAETKEGHLIASWFGGTKERNPDVCIWVSRYVDGKWTAPENVANGIVNDTLRYACWNPVLFQVPGKELQLYYKVGPNVAGWKAKMISSNDGGLSWSEPRDLPDDFIGPVKNKPVLLKNGLLLSPSSTEGKGGWRVHIEYSKDMGKTWKKTASINDGEEFKIIQPSILTYPDGRLQLLCRSQQRAVIESWSYDQGMSWTPVAPTMLPNNNSGTDAVSLQDGRQLIIYNHVLPHDTLKRGKGARTPLNVAVSEDGKTWYAALVLEDSPISQYSYPAVIQTKDGLVHFVYTWRRKAIKHVVVDPKQWVLSEMKEMKWPSATETSAIGVVNNQRYKVSACDWMMLKRQKIGAMQLAAEIGADGLELDMGGLGKRVAFDNKLRDTAFQEQFRAEFNKHGIQLSSIAMSAFYGQSFGKRENYEALIDDCIATMQVMGAKVAFLPLGNATDLKKEPELYQEVVRRLQVAGRKAEAAGVVIGVETNLTAKEEVALLKAVGSPAIKIYVNFSTILKRKGNILKELKTLGKDRIAQIHVSNTDGHWIENDPALDMHKVKQTLDKMGWSGWLVVERSRDTNDVHNVKWNYGANVRYLKSVFQE